MTTIIAKIFIIMTMVFEVITITTGSALYPVFTAACAIIFGCIILQLVMAVLTVANIDSAGQEIIYGVIIIGVLILYSFRSLRRS